MFDLALTSEEPKNFSSANAPCSKRRPTRAREDCPSTPKSTRCLNRADASPLGRRRHITSVRARIASGSPGAAIAGRRALPSAEALADELETLSNRPALESAVSISQGDCGQGADRTEPDKSARARNGPTIRRTRFHPLTNAERAARGECLPMIGTASGWRKSAKRKRSATTRTRVSLPSERRRRGRSTRQRRQSSTRSRERPAHDASTRSGCGRPENRSTISARMRTVIGAVRSTTIRADRSQGVLGARRSV